ncbi:MAG: nitroreductase family protein [Acidobacteria bacterium]|nr:nitroreductase family protein [Acidobacteriota bacterium]
MENSAETQHSVHELIKNRWSPRAFSARAVEPEKLLSLLEAARWAASCFNEQPWNFIVATKEEGGDGYERLLGCLVEANALWARHAPVLMISVARLDFKRNGKPNRHALHDTGQAAAHLALQATALGLAVHQMAGFDASKAREQFSIPEGFEPVAAIAVGYPGDPADLPEELRDKELAQRTRLPLEDFVFGGNWRETSPLVR